MDTQRSRQSDSQTNRSRSQQHFQDAQKYLPLGVCDSYRYWGDRETIYIDHGKGARVWDIDNNPYIDFRLAYGPIILGYCDVDVDAAAAAAIQRGVLFGLSTLAEVAFARNIIECVTSVDKIRLANSGTEAVMAALRLARGVSGKDAYVIVEGSFHGLFDAAMWRTNVEEWSPNIDAAPDTIPFGKGIPQHARKLLHTVPLNDANALEDLLKSHGSKIGAVLIEPIMGNCCAISATQQYMQDMRALCDQYNVLLVVDEIKTGFRVGLGGVQELYGITADLSTFAKAIANGYPIAAFGGRADIMDQITMQNGVVHGGTYCGHAVALAAANATLKKLRTTSCLEQIKQTGQALQKGLGEILTRRGVPHCFTGHPSMFGVMLAEDAPTNYRDWRQTDFTSYEKLAQNALGQGLLLEPDSREPWFVCAAHSDIALEEILEKFDAAVSETF